MKTYDRVKLIMIEKEQARNDDKFLIWEYWRAESYGLVLDTIDRYFFLNNTTPTESITRARRKIQELHRELWPTDQKVIKMRRLKEKTKGTFIFREDIKKGQYL